MHFKLIISAFFILINFTVFACDKANLVDFDIKIIETLNKEYSTWGREFILDGEKKCVYKYVYNTCIRVTPTDKKNFLLSIDVSSNSNQSYITTFEKMLKFNTDQYVKFDDGAITFSGKFYVNKTIVQFKMKGKKCDSGFPIMPRRVSKDQIYHSSN